MARGVYSSLRGDHLEFNLLGRGETYIPPSGLVSEQKFVFDL